MVEEMFDVCDEADRVLRTAPRSEVHARGWLHRAVHIFVFNSRGELLLHRRSSTKDESPLKLTSSASGHLAAGEDYDVAAERELDEELGLSGRLERLHKFPASPLTAFEHTVLYRIVSDQPPAPNPEEIAEVEFAALDEVQRRLKAEREDFSSPFRVCLEWYFEHGAFPAGEEAC